MKEFCKFSTFFIFIVSIALALFEFIIGCTHLLEYLKAETLDVKYSYLTLMSYSFFFVFLILAVGFALTSILILLIKLAYKDDGKIIQDNKINE